MQDSPNPTHPEFAILLDRAESILDAIREVRSQPIVDLKRLRRLNKQLSQTADEMEALLPGIKQANSVSTDGQQPY